MHEEVYRGYRIAIKHTGSWTARITDARGPVVPISAHAEEAEGVAVCAERARAAVDRYLAFLKSGASERDDA